MPATKTKAMSKRKKQHQEAIQGYEKWLKKHPEAKRKARVSAFDRFVDSSELEEILNG